MLFTISVLINYHANHTQNHEVTTKIDYSFRAINLYRVKRSALFVLCARWMVQTFGVQRSKPSDKLGQKFAKILTWPNSTRSRLTRLVFTENLVNCPLGQLEDAFVKVCNVDALEKRVTRTSKVGDLQSLRFYEQISEALEKNILNKQDAQVLQEADLARQLVISVDDFTTNELAHQIHPRDVGVKIKDTKKKAF